MIMQDYSKIDTSEPKTEYRLLDAVGFLILLALIIYSPWWLKAVINQFIWR